MSNPRPIELKGKPISGNFPLLCTPLVGREPQALLDEVAAVLPKNPDVIEWRVDFFDAIADTQRVVDTARRIRTAAATTPILFTRRSSREGGERVALDEADVVALYESICASGLVDLVDYELGNASDDVARVRAASREYGVALILSFHDFRSTPSASALLETFSRAQERGADVAKVAVMPKDAGDVLTLLAATFEASRTLSIPLISMSMGAVGSVSRMVGGVFGSALTFAVGKSSSAPGQIPIDELRAALATVNRAVGIG